ncbi:MAG: hypothetical protein ABWZ25_02090 [Chitinophagaceae bacterium]
MKLTSLIIHYLYTNQRLDLPGIGTFILDRSVVSQLDNPKHRVPITEGITFESKPGLPESEELISYISSETGKMRSLASADLESEIQTVKQFLNIGKAFTFEGLGTLVRRPTGEVEFSPAFLIPETSRPVPATGHFSERQEPAKKYESFLTETKKVVNVSRPVLTGLVIGGILLAIVAGYLISRPGSKDSSDTAAAAASLPQDTTPTPETTAIVSSTPVIKTDQVKTKQSSNYKYILEVAKSARAFKRYKQLRTNLWEVELETKDSVDYKLVLKLPSMNADTTRIVDSLTAMLGRKVYIEHQN